MNRSNENMVAIAPAGLDRDRPTGLFYRLQVDMSGSMRMGVETRLFLPGNRISRVFPYGGGNAFDLQRCSPDTCGRWEVDAGHLAVRWDNGVTDRWRFASTSAGIELDGTSFKPARAMSQAELVGAWTASGGAGNPFANVYRFASDGEFMFGTGQGGMSGRFHLQGSTLMLAFADGSQAQRTVFAASAHAPIGLICVEGEVFARSES